AGAVAHDVADRRAADSSFPTDADADAGAVRGPAAIACLEAVAADGGADRRAADIDVLFAAVAEDIGADRRATEFNLFDAAAADVGVVRQAAEEDLLDAAEFDDGVERHAAVEDVLGAQDGGVDHRAAGEDNQSVACVDGGAGEDLTARDICHDMLPQLVGPLQPRSKRCRRFAGCCRLGGG